MRRLTDELRAEGWGVLPISLQQLLLDRVRATGHENIEALIAREKRLFDKAAERALAHLRDKIAPHIEGPGGIAADVARLIDAFADEHPDRTERTLVLIGRAGALYPFFRSSALLNADVTRDIPPVVYFHEQSPAKLQSEVAEYIVTGGHPEADPRARRVRAGIHEQFVHLLRGIRRELEKSGGPELPAAWISGFYAA
jgi:hypothetical protein